MNPQKPPGDDPLTITSPASGDTVGPLFTAYGSCSGLTSSSTITASLSVPPPTPGPPPTVVPGSVTTNANDGTWEAFFTGVPGGSNATLAVTCEVPALTTHTASAKNLATGFLGAGIATEPTQSGIATRASRPDQPKYANWGAVKLTGSRMEAWVVTSFVLTRSGKTIMTQSNPEIPHENKDGRATFSQNLAELFARWGNPDQVLSKHGGNFTIIFEIFCGTPHRDDPTLWVSSGYFTIEHPSPPPPPPPPAGSASR